MKRFISFVLICLLFSSPLSFTFAREKLALERGRDLANQFLENSLSDEAWKDNYPTISKETLFHTDDEKKNSYVEYKISCDKNPDCGFILVNIDGNDVAVPISSPTGNTPSEILSQGSEDEKYYYFSPFDMYSENTISGDIQALDPQKQVDLRDDTKVKGTKEEKEVNKVAHEKLKSELKEAKKVAKEFKKSQEFKEMKEEIQEQILTVPKEEYSFNVLPQANAAYYTSPGTSDIFIAGGNYTTGCNGQTPCYSQFDTTYNSLTCRSGCTPTAMGIIFGWYDRNGFPNLLPGTAARTNNTDVQNMIKTIGIYMKTSCTSADNTGNTDYINITKGIQYAKDKGYTTATATPYNNSTNAYYFDKIKTEINTGKPIMINIANSSQGEGHTIVGFGYKSTGTAYIVRVNMGWLPNDTAPTNTSPTYYTSNIDQNLNSIFYKTGYTHIVNSIVTVKMN